MPRLTKFGKLLALVLCCMLLVLFTVEAAHMHAPGADTTHCALCVVAHLGLVGVQAAAMLCVLAVLARIAARRCAAGHRASTPVQRIRPPPLDALGFHSVAV